jgi:hypothetical protein
MWPLLEQKTMLLLPTSERLPGNPSVAVHRLLRSKTLACGFLLFIVWTGYFFYPSMRNRVVGQIVGNHPQKVISAEDFVSTAIQTTINSYDAKPVYQYCMHDNWNASMVVNCDRIFGGIGKQIRSSECFLHN